MNSMASISTPAALIDEQRMAQNIARMQQRVSSLGARFRPHAKTAKCIEVARRQAAAGAAGITVSTLKEAEQFFAAGFTDILYAVCMAPNKIAQAAALIERGCDLVVVVDSVAAAQAIAAVAPATARGFDVMIEIDTDGHRSGVQPDAPELLAIAATLQQGGARVKGVMAHAGSSYDVSTPEALAEIAEAERSKTVHAATRLRAAGFSCPEVSIGSTPTALSAATLEGVTEVRAGVYVFFDLVMANVGICRVDELALSVLTTVIGHQPEKGWVIVDAGWMAMSRDRGTMKQAIDYGYGAVADAQGSVIDGVVLSGANQEHGILSSASGTPIASPELRFPIGTQLRIYPNHACATGAQFPEYQVVTSAGHCETWPRFYGW